MTTITLHYALSDLARRAELAAGRPAGKERSIELVPTPELAALAELRVEAGVIELICSYLSEQGSLRGHLGHASDTVLTADTAPEWIASRQAAIQAESARLATEYAQRQTEIAERQAADREAIRLRTEPTRQLVRRYAAGDPGVEISSIDTPAYRWISVRDLDGSDQSTATLGYADGDDALIASCAERAQREIADREEQQRVLVRDAERDLLSAHGTPSQLERWTAGVLPDSELRDLAREILYAPLAEQARYIRLETGHDGDLGHEEDCGGDDAVTVSDSAGPYTAAQWIAIEALRVLAGCVPGAELIVRVHRLACTDSYRDCAAEVKRLSGRITTRWAGRDLTREYAID